MHAFDVMGDPVRRRILELLAEGEHASGAVVEVVGAEFGITQSAVSQHLKVLREAGFAHVRADGARRLYAIEPAAISEIDAWLDKFRAFWVPKMESLATEVARGKRGSPPGSLREPPSPLGEGTPQHLFPSPNGEGQAAKRPGWGNPGVEDPKTTARARELRRTMTDAEVRLWARLKRLRERGYHFRRQAPFRGWFLDFVCFDRRLAIEIDGWRHAEDAHAVKDAIRDQVLQREGFQVLRFWNRELDSDIGEVMDAIHQALEDRPSVHGKVTKDFPSPNGERQAPQPPGWGSGPASPPVSELRSDPPSPSGEEKLKSLRGSKRTIAQTLAELEAHPEDPEVQSLLDAAWNAQTGIALGLTGPPGVGKSTLANALVKALRVRGQSVAVAAVDPSSRASGGAILGDRARIDADPADQSVFVRSFAARDRLGGLADLAAPATVLFRSLFDWTLIETVGVGQSETEIADIADLVLFCAQPASGDALQFMKAGVMEIPDIAVVTKADMGAPARRAAADLKASLALAVRDKDPPRVLTCSASTGEGIDALIDALATLAKGLSGPELIARRRAQGEAFVAQSLKARFGREGYGALGDEARLRWEETPFQRERKARSALKFSLP